MAALRIFRTLVALFSTTLATGALSAPGDLDTTFSGDGKASATLAVDSVGKSVAIQGDGKIVVAGNARDSVGRDSFAVARFLSTGIQDPTFGSGGQVVTAVGVGSASAYAACIQADGKIVVGGIAYNGTNEDFALVRYTENGALDTSFGAGTGKVMINVGDSDDYALAVAVQSDGKILIAGQSITAGTGIGAFTLVRRTLTGDFDPTFGGGTGRAVTTIGDNSSTIRSIALQSDGGIVVAGGADLNARHVFTLARYTSSGYLDTTFGSGTGIVSTRIGNGSADVAQAVALQTDGRIVVGGFADVDNTQDLAVARYLSTGVLDTTFGGGLGYVTKGFELGSRDYGYGVAIQRDGKIVLAGYRRVTGVSSNADFAVARFLGNGTLDATFNGTGLKNTAFGSYNDYGAHIAIQKNGAILVAGYANVTSSANFDFAIARFQGDPIATYTATPSAGSNGMIGPSTPQIVAVGDSITFTATPAPGFAVDQWTVNGSIVQTGGVSLTRTNVQTNLTVAVTFKSSIPSYAIFPVAGENGAITPSTTQTAFQGTDKTFTATPNAGYTVSDWWLDNTTIVQTGGTTYQLTNITAQHTVSVYFTPIKPTIIAQYPPASLGSTSATFTAVYNANGGRVVPQFYYRTGPYDSPIPFGPVTPSVVTGTDDTVVTGTLTGLTAGTDYIFTAGGDIGTSDGYYFTTGFDVTPIAGAHGTVSPGNTRSVSRGGRIVFTAKPDPEWNVAQWLVDGVVMQDGGDSFGLTGVTAATTVEVTFTEGLVELAFDDSHANFHFVLADSKSHDVIVVTAAKGKLGRVGKVRQVDYTFGKDSVVPGWPDASVRFLPDKNGFPARISSNAGVRPGRQNISFAWKRGLGSVRIASTLGRQHHATATRTFPAGIGSLLDSSYLGAQTPWEAAQSGDLERWLADICQTVGTWAYVAAETIIIGPTPEGNDLGIVMDPRWSQGRLPIADFCAAIGGLNEAFQTSRESTAAKSGVSETIAPELGTPSAPRIITPKFNSIGRSYAFQGRTEPLNPGSWFIQLMGLDGVIQWIHNRAEVARQHVSEPPRQAGALKIYWVNSSGFEIGRYRPNVKENTTISFVVERVNGGAGRLSGGLTVTKGDSRFEAIEGKGRDFIFSDRTIVFEDGETGPKKFLVRILADNENDDGEEFQIKLMTGRPSDDTSLTASIASNPNSTLIGHFSAPAKVTFYDSLENYLLNKRTTIDVTVSGSVIVGDGGQPNTYKVSVLWTIDAGGGHIHSYSARYDANYSPRDGFAKDLVCDNLNNSVHLVITPTDYGTHADVLLRTEWTEGYNSNQLEIVTTNHDDVSLEDPARP